MGSFNSEIFLNANMDQESFHLIAISIFYTDSALRSSRELLCREEPYKLGGCHCIVPYIHPCPNLSLNMLSPVAETLTYPQLSNSPNEPLR